VLPAQSKGERVARNLPLHGQRLHKDWARDGCFITEKLSTLSYRQLKRYNCPSAYRLAAISRAAGILASRKKSLRRGYPTKTPYMSKRVLISCYGFKIEDGNLRIPLGEKKFEFIPLTPHLIQILSDPVLNVRSFTLNETVLSLCISKEVAEVECSGTVGVDRNLRNLTVGNQDRVTQYDLSDAVRIADTTRRIISSFKRDDDRIREELSSKYGRRRRSHSAHLPQDNESCSGQRPQT
jgi:putative transposase